MRRRLWLSSVVLLAVNTFAAPALFRSPSESRWTVSEGKRAAGTLTLLTGTTGSRAEWRASDKAAATVFIGTNGHVWVRGSGGDTDLASTPPDSIANVVAPALLLPFTTSPTDKVESAAGRTTSYSYRGAKAAYQHDARGPSRIEIFQGTTHYTLTRTSMSASNADAGTFAVRPKASAASRLSRLSGDLLASSDTSVAATAGGRGAGHAGLKLNDGGDYDQVAKLEKRDAGWKSQMDTALSTFQKEGKVGREREAH